MASAKHANKLLNTYLENQDYEESWALIRSVIQNDNDINAKYDLLCLLMNGNTMELIIDNLQRQLCHIYLSDKNIEAYLDKAVQFNPLLGYVSIEARSRRDMKNESSLCIGIPVTRKSDIDKQCEEAERIMTTVKEVLTMMLVESRTIPV